MNTKKILIIILILFSVAPLLLSHTLIFLQEETIHNDAIKNLNAIASIQHKRIQQLINNKQESVALIASNVQLQKSVAKSVKFISNKKTVSIIINNALKAMKSIDNISLYAINQEIIYSAKEKSASYHKHIFDDTEHFKSKVQSIELNQKSDQSINIEIIAPLFLHNDVIGYISVEFYANELLTILSDYNGLGNTGEMVLAGKNEQGDTQFLTPTRHHSNFPLNITIDKDNQNIPITYAINGKSAILKDYSDYRHVPVLAISRYIPETDWGMIVKIDYDEVFYQLNNLKTFAIIFTLIFIITIIIIAIYLNKKIPDPIYTLESITALIKEGDAQIKTPNSFLNEIDKLGNAFNSMVSLLSNSESYLRNSVKKLTQANIILLAEAKRFKRWKESKFIGIIHSDDTGRIIDANEALLNMIGYTKEDLNNGSIDWLKLTPPEFHQRGDAAIEEAEKKGYWTPFEKAYRHKNGHHVPILIGGSIFQHDVREYIVFVVDLSDRNKKLDELAKYKGIIENSRDLFAFIDIHYQFKTVNPAYLHAYGLHQDQVINKSIADVLGQEYFEQEIKKSIDDVLAGKTLNFVKTQNFKAIGKRDIMVTYTPYKDSKNRIIGLIYKGEDITQLQKQRKLIALQVAEQEQIVASMLEGIITTNDSGIILSFNPEASSIFGYSESEIIGKNASILMPKEVASRHANHMLDYLRSNSSSFVGNRLGREVIALHKDNHTFPLRISVAELPCIEGEKMNFIANCQDLTEIEQQKEMLNRTLRMESLGKVSGGIAHDFNNLLGIIMGYCELLKIKMTHDDEKRFLAGISLACERGTKLTKSLLTFSKSQPSETKAYNINTIILDNQRMLETMLTTKVSLTLNLAESLPRILIDKSLFEDMLLNFSINALQAMQDGGELTIKTKSKKLSKRQANLLNIPSGYYVKLTVEDSGCGIDEENLSKIYEPFFTTKEELGNGLGLYQCYGFVKSSHGAIEVQSTVGKGTIFCIYFPEVTKEIEDIEDINKPTQVSNHFSPQDYTILIVDDEVDIRYLNSRFLTDEGFVVHSCDNAFDALTLLNNENIDFIITDVVMPKMGGVELVKQAKLLKPDVKYLFVSGYLDIKDSKEVDLIKPILYKPYKAESLIKNIKEALSSSKDFTA